MLKWIIIGLGVIVAIPIILVVVLYYMIFYQDVALTRTITYDQTEEAITAQALAGMLDGLAGITLTDDQMTELEDIVDGFVAGTKTVDDLTDFMIDDTTGVLVTNAISLTGGIGLELTETQINAVANLLISNLDTMLASFDVNMPEGLTSSRGSLSYNVEGFGNVTISDLGINVDASGMQIVLKITLPTQIEHATVNQWAGWLIKGKSISIGVRPTIVVDESTGRVNMDLNLDTLQLGGIKASWPGVSYLTDWAKDTIGESTLQFGFNPSDPFNSMLGYDLGLTLTLEDTKLSLAGPPSLVSLMRNLDLDTEEIAEYALAAQDEIDDFTEALDTLGAGDTVALALSEENLTALLTQEVDEQFEDSFANLGVDMSGVNVNVNDDGMTMSTVMSLPEDAGLGLPEALLGAEIEIAFQTELVIDDEGNASMQVTGVDLGGLPPALLEEFGLSTEELIESLSAAEIDLGDILGLPEGALAGFETSEEGGLVLTATGE